MTDAIDTETTELPVLTQTSRKTVQTYRMNQEGEVRLTSDDGFEEFYAETLDVLYGEDGWERSVVKGRVIGKNNRLLQKIATRTYTVAAGAPVWMIPERDNSIPSEYSTKITRAFSGMRYAAHAFTGPGDFRTFDGVVTKLNALGKTLVWAGDQNARNERELETLRTERRAIGSFLLGAMESAAEGREQS